MQKISLSSSPNAEEKPPDQTNQGYSLSDFIPYNCHVSPHTILTTNGNYLRTGRMNLSHKNTTHTHSLATLPQHTAPKNLSIWTHYIGRKRTHDHTIIHEQYLTLVYTSNSTKTSKNLAHIKKTKDIAIKELEQFFAQIQTNLPDHHFDALCAYEDEEHHLPHSDFLVFLNFLISGEWQKMRVPRIPLYEHLGNARIFINTNIIEIKTPTRSRYAQALQLKEDVPSGLLNLLADEHYEYVLTQVFTQEKCEHHVLIFGDTVESVRCNTAVALAAIQESGFSAALISNGLDAVFYAQFPGR